MIAVIYIIAATYVYASYRYHCHKIFDKAKKNN